MAKPLKATFQTVDENGNLGEPLPVNFNPTEYTLNKGAQIAEITIPGLDSPLLQFVRGQTESLSLDLFFDTTESGMDDTAISVTSLTDKFYKLVKMNGTSHAPPICFFAWGEDFPGRRNYGSAGSQQRHGFKCVVESVRQRFTLFSPQGVPLRATLTISLREYKTLKEQIDELNLSSPDRTHSHVVQVGETINQISANIYNDSTQWRAIAIANSLTDPLDLHPGTVLVIPPLAAA
ncbi:MAG: peptidoglycan-binding protein [Verrucomicrobia bacterium]|nr:MAG: peptidoglycan-binding protein [Verrucomicrobiota bacterium]